MERTLRSPLQLYRSRYWYRRVCRLFLVFVSFSQAHLSFSHSLHLPPPLCGNSKVLTGSEETEHLLSVSGTTETIQEYRWDPYLYPSMSLWPPFLCKWKLGQKETMGSSSQLPKQDYETLQKKCLRVGCLFEDTSFPATLSSIGRGPLLQKLPTGLQWKRPWVRGQEGGFHTTNTKSINTDLPPKGFQIPGFTLCH